MTPSHRTLFPRKQITRAARLGAGQLRYCVMTTFCFLLILRNSEAAIEYMGRGLSLCARTVIPSLFPFMVLSELVVSSGAGEAFGRLFSRVMRWVFGLSGAGVSAVLLGSMCGFPVGARTAVSLYDRNLISKAECEHLLTFTSNPSSAFLISAVGVSIFGNRRLGVTLYATVLLSSFFVGFLARFFIRGQGKPEGHPHFPSGLHPGGVEMFTSAVSGAATSMVSVCAYVIFFSALTGSIGSLIEGIGGLGEVGYTALFGFLEMTGGISEAAGLSSEKAAVAMAAGIAGWSGLSVHFQVMSLCGGRGLSFKPYIIAKAVQGILCATAVTVILSIGNPVWLAPAKDTLMNAIVVVTSMKDFSVPAILSNGVFILGWVIGRVRPASESEH